MLQGTRLVINYKQYKTTSQLYNIQNVKVAVTTVSAAVGSCQAVDVLGMGGGAEEGDQVVIGGVPTRPSSASTTGHSNTWEVSAVCAFERFIFFISV